MGTVSKDFFNTRGWVSGGCDAKDRDVKECTCGKCFYLGKQGFEILTELLARVQAVYGNVSLGSIYSFLLLKQQLLHRRLLVPTSRGSLPVKKCCSR